MRMVEARRGASRAAPGLPREVSDGPSRGKPGGLSHGTPSRLRRSVADDRGAVIVEFAAVFVVFMTLLAGLITFGMAFAVKQSVEHGTSEAARAVVGMRDSDDARDRMEVVLNDQLGWLGGLGGDARIESVRWDACGGECLEVATVYDGGLLRLMPFRFAAPDQVGASATIRHDLEEEGGS